MSQSRLNAFDQYLRQNAIPIDGLSGSTPYGPDTVTIQFSPSATQQQIDWANAALASFDWRPRRFLPAATIASTLNGLTAQQQNAILRRVVAYIIMQNEQWILQVASDLGVSVPYDEVDPS